jgi:pyruvate formate lyase activating enzyme
MKISGLQKTSLIDYPENIVSIVFTQGCNYSCPYCHNANLIPLDSEERDYLPLEYLYAFLNDRKGLIDGVSITGGEPTIQKDLLELIQGIKSLGLKVKLDTNGSNPQVIKKLLDKELLDYLAMDIKGSLKKYDEITGQKINPESLKKSINLIMNSGIDYEFRTTVVPTLHESNDFKEIGELIKGAENYFIQNFRPVNTYNPQYLKLNGFPVSILKQFKEIIKPYVKRVEIRD